MDQTRWEALLAHRERLLALALSRGMSAEDAKDVVQEAMLRCAEFERLDLNRLPQFLTTVTIRLCADVHRKHDEPQRAQRWLAPLLHDEPDPAEVVCRDHGPEWVESLVGKLPEQQRNVLEDRASGLSIQQIATRRRLTYKAAESALARARAALRSAVATSWSVAALVNRRIRGLDVPITASAATASFAVTAALVGAFPMLEHRPSHPPREVVLPMTEPSPGAGDVVAAAYAPRPALTPLPSVPLAHATRSYKDPVPTFGATSGPVTITREPVETPIPQRVLYCVQNGIETWPTVYCRSTSPSPSPEGGR